MLIPVSKPNSQQRPKMSPRSCDWHDYMPLNCYVGRNCSTRVSNPGLLVDRPLLTTEQLQPFFTLPNFTLSILFICFMPVFCAHWEPHLTWAWHTPPSQLKELHGLWADPFISIICIGSDRHTFSRVTILQLPWITLKQKELKYVIIPNVHEGKQCACMHVSITQAFFLKCIRSLYCFIFKNMHCFKILKSFLLIVVFCVEMLHSRTAHFKKFPTM